MDGFYENHDMLKWYVNIIHGCVLCATDRKKLDDAPSSMNVTKVIHYLISYSDDAFVFLILVNNHDGWMKRIPLMNDTTDPINKGCI